MGNPDIKSNISRSESELSEYASRLDEECTQLLVDIRRIGVEGEPHTTFGELFDDDEVSNYYEALVGTLKAAKKTQNDYLPGAAPPQGRER
mmetsp:Transcript_11137/g.28220  ORF Transcript_11137/g.28220 Transcript_11137/m.28220 type:complete len:91 (-) Transcript_11137:382-654(-)